MNTLELNISDILKSLNESYGMQSVKIEFGEEGTSSDEALRLKETVSLLGLDLTVKIGGCEAVRDLKEAKQLSASSIVAPMIETPYALKKYVNSINDVFSEQERQNVKFLINIETVTGYCNLDDILNSEDFSYISGIALGRNDMACSLGLSSRETEHPKIIEMAKHLSLLTKNMGKDFIIGGNISSKTLWLLNELNFLSGYETRKIIFNAKTALNKPNPELGIKKALEFEMAWLKSKKNISKKESENDVRRIKILEERCKS